ncbi:TPA: Vir protein, partial [Legionella pneumophila subsp. pneumophila]|nr:Vir protein [Legionella pneumophila]HAT8889729.1 Vir protein [Legionella pneumophila subsp. pneumophila]
MDFLFVTTYELDALREIPLIQRVVYLMGIRPYMDRKTFMVGIKRKISYQSLRETLYVAPIKGVKTGCPSHQQMKRVIKSLARQGIIEIRSTTKNLIVKCLLANPYEPVEIESESQPKNSPPTQAEQNQSAPPENLKLMKTGKL